MGLWKLDNKGINTDNCLMLSLLTLHFCYGRKCKVRGGVSWMLSLYIAQHGEIFIHNMLFCIFFFKATSGVLTHFRS